MDINRCVFTRGGLSALGSLALDGLPVFATPVGFKLRGNPLAVTYSTTTGTVMPRKAGV